MNRALLAFAAALSLLLVGSGFAQTSSQSRPPSASSSTNGSAPSQNSPSSSLIDINSASAQELDALPGIGSARANAIIKNRPYRGKNELVDRHIIPSNVYAQIKDRIIAHQGTATPPSSSQTGAGSGPNSAARSTGTSTGSTRQQPAH